MPDLPVAAPDPAADTMPLLAIHGAALYAMAEGEPEEAAHITVILARRLREAEAERQQDKEHIERLLAALRKGDEQVSTLHDELYADFGEKGVPHWVKLGLEAVNVEVWKAHEILRAALAVEEDAE